MKIQVLGSGCPTCQKLHELVLSVAKELNLEEEVEYLSGSEGLARMMELGAMQSPVLAIDGKAVMTGFSQDKKKIKDLILANSKEEVVPEKSHCHCQGKCANHDIPTQKCCHNGACADC